MLGWSIGFLAAAMIAALFAFGVIATPYAALAQAALWVCLVIFALTLLSSLFLREHGGAFARGGRTIAMLAIVAGLGFVCYAWVQNHWTAERLGREIDRQVAQLSSGADQKLHRSR